MASVRDGLTGIPDMPEGEPGDSFDAMLAEQAAKPREGATAPTPTARQPVDPSADSAQDITAAMIGGPTSPTSVRSGLTLSEPSKPEPLRVELSPENRALVEQAERDLAAQDAALARGRAAEEELAIAGLNELLPTMDSRAQLVGYLADLRGRVSGDRFSDLLVHLARDLSGVDPSAEYSDQEDLDAFSAELLLLDGEVEQTQAERRHEDAVEMFHKLLPVAAKDVVEGMKSEISSWMHDQGLSPAEARARLDVMQQAAPDLIGVNLDEIHDRRAFAGALRAVDAALADSTAAETTRAIQQAIVDAPSTDVRSGMTEWTVFGQRPMFETNLDAVYGPPLADPGRAVARSQARRVTGADIRREVALPDGRSVADGLTIDGRPAADVIREHEAEERRLRERRI